VLAGSPDGGPGDRHQLGRTLARLFSSRGLGIGVASGQADRQVHEQESPGILLGDVAMS